MSRVKYPLPFRRKRKSLDVLYVEEIIKENGITNFEPEVVKKLLHSASKYGRDLISYMGLDEELIENTEDEVHIDGEKNLNGEVHSDNQKTMDMEVEFQANNQKTIDVGDEAHSDSQIAMDIEDEFQANNKKTMDMENEIDLDGKTTINDQNKVPAINQQKTDKTSEIELIEDVAEQSSFKEKVQSNRIIGTNDVTIAKVLLKYENPTVEKVITFHNQVLLSPNTVVFHKFKKKPVADSVHGNSVL